MRLRTDIKELHHVAVAFEQAKTRATRRANDKRNSDSGTSSILPSSPRRRSSRRTSTETVRGTKPQERHNPNILRPRGGALTAASAGSYSHTNITKYLDQRVWVRPRSIGTVHKKLEDRAAQLARPHSGHSSD